MTILLLKEGFMKISLTFLLSTFYLKSLKRSILSSSYSWSANKKYLLGLVVAIRR